MAAAWHGGLADDDQFVKDPTLRTDISSAMGYWFGRDFTNPACLDSGGTPACPCTNPDNSLWYVSQILSQKVFSNSIRIHNERNTNWFSNVGVMLSILMS